MKVIAMAGTNGMVSLISSMITSVLSAVRLVEVTTTLRFHRVYHRIIMVITATDPYRDYDLTENSGSV